jgi:hypothetical protein
VHPNLDDWQAEIRAAADQAVLWWYICFALGLIATVTLIVGFFYTCILLKRINETLRKRSADVAIQAERERSSSPHKIPPLR